MQRTAAPRKASSPDTSRKRGAGAAAVRVVGGLCWSGLRAAARRPAVLLAGIAILGGAGVFAWNATMKQTARHPAPLFAEAKPVAAKAEPARRAEPASPQTTGATRPDVPLPPSRQGGPDAIGSIIRTSEGPARAAEARPRPAEARPKQAEAKKPADKKPAEVKKTAEAKPAAAKHAEAKPKAAGPAGDKPAPRVVSAQKALAKLGYGPIATDGLFGSNTRLAIEKFERDRKLPVTGALGPNTVKQLASRSGISIE